MKYNVITPFKRYNNFDLLVNNLENKDVTWHIITDDDSDFNININKTWIKHYVCPNKNVNFWERCNFSINWFLDNQNIEEEEMYCILNDDDAYEEDFFKKITQGIEISENKNLNNDIVICSMERGHNIPADVVFPRVHNITKLWGRPECMHIGGVGVEQIILKGKKLKNYRLPLEICGDGMFITEILKTNECIYIPQANVYFNYFEPGRWNK